MVCSGWMVRDSIMENIVQKISPPASDLSKIVTEITCTEHGCNKKFHNSSNLDMHLVKHHKKGDPNQWRIKNTSTVIHYHCPEEKCIYNLDTDGKFFLKMKYLKQHYLKVHAEKSFKCTSCAKGFPTEAAMKHHTSICGMKFICSCNAAYDSNEALTTHVKRSGHIKEGQYKPVGKGCAEVLPGMPTSSILQNIPAMPVYLAAVALSELSSGFSLSSANKGIQTEPTTQLEKRQRSKTTSSKSADKGTKRGTSQQTQTGVSKNKRQRISTETQTSGDYILKKAMQAAEIPTASQKQTAGRKRRKSMETQTNTGVRQSFKEHGCRPTKISPSINDKTIEFISLDFLPNTSSYELDIDVGLPDLWSGQRNSSGTQTSPGKSVCNNLEVFNSITQTDPQLLDLFENESCEPCTSYMHSSSQTVKLSGYSEDNNSSSCFGNDPMQSNNYDLASTCPSFASFDDPGYSCAQMESILTRNNKYVFDENRSCSIGSQTEIDSFLAPSECVDDDTPFTLSSTIETQTTEDTAFDQLIYANMCTQTCDDFLFPDLGFVDIQTQTAWSEYGEDASLVSTETQTALSGRSNMSTWTLSETSHMETQTDEFRELIAEFEKQNKSEKLL